MEKLVALAVGAGLIVAGLIHLPPVTGVAGAESLRRLYGTAIASPDLLLLMRHRAVLLGVIGAFMIAAAFRSEWRFPALIVGLVSVFSFLALAWPMSELSAALRKVFIVDVVAGGALLAALAMLGHSSSHS